MKVHTAVARALAEQGVNTVFTLMAEDIFGITATIQEGEVDGITVVETRHEQGAVAAADGYARASGDVGVCVVGRGPAIAQTGTGLGTADAKGSNVLVVTSETPTGATGDIKEFRQQSYLESLVDDVRSVRDEDALVPAFEGIFHELRRGPPGPVVVQIPWDVMERDVQLPDDWRRRIGTAGSPTPGDARLQPDRRVIDEAVDRYLDSDATVPPVILAGDGAVRADAKPAIESVAERTNAVLATTLQAQGYFADHPYSVGFVGTFGSTLANEYLARSDYVLAVGCSLNDHTTDNGRLVDGATVVHVDHDPAAIGRHDGVDLAIVGDARVTVERIDDALAAENVDFEGKFWTDRLARRIEETPVWDRGEGPDRPNRVDQRDLVAELDTVLPTDRLVVTDGGHFINWVLDGITTTHPDDYEWTIDFGAVGLGLPIALGAAVAIDDRTVVAFCGDAGFMMSIQELDTAVRQNLPVVVIVMNDDALGSEYHQLRNKGRDPEAAVVETPDIAAIADAHGAAGYTIRSVDDVDALRAELEGLDGPVVADCKTNRDVRHRFYDTDHMM